MKREAIDDAARLLIEARATGRLLPALPDSCRPATLDDAHAIQDAVAAALGERIAGWKVAKSPEGRIIRGGILQSRVVASGAALPSARVPLLGVESEIAFRFDRSLPPRAREYDYDEVAAAVTAFMAIEIVASRFATYPKTPLLDRVADFMANGAFVAGDSIPNWRSLDLSQAEVELMIDGVSVVRSVGGHIARDPLIPAIELVNDLRATGIDAGRLMTTGTYTGLHFAKPGQTARAVFHGIGAVDVHFD